MASMPLCEKPKKKKRLKTKTEEEKLVSDNTNQLASVYLREKQDKSDEKRLVETVDQVTNKEETTQKETIKSIDKNNGTIEKHAELQEVVAGPSCEEISKQLHLPETAEESSHTEVSEQVQLSKIDVGPSYAEMSKNLSQINSEIRAEVIQTEVELVAPSAPLMEEENVIMYPDLSEMKNQLIEIGDQNLDICKFEYERFRYQTKHKIKPLDIWIKDVTVNTFLENHEDFITTFMIEQYNLRENMTRNEFYILLFKYLKARDDFVGNLKKCQDLKTKFDNYKIDDIWIKTEKRFKNYGLCKDNVNVCASVVSKVSTLDEEKFNEMKDACRLWREAVHHQAAYAYVADVLKIEIEKQVQALCDELQRNSLNDEYLKTSDIYRYFKTCISILFRFQRQHYEKQFQEDTQNWLTLMISQLLDKGFVKDYFFIINLVLRCRPGFGKWAAPYLQCPEPVANKYLPILSNNMECCLTLLHIILIPIRERQTFLMNYEENADGKTQISDVWELIDSDGEVDKTDHELLKESDIITLLNQIPFEKIFCAALLIDNERGNYIINQAFSIKEHLEKTIHFFTKFIYVLGGGMKTYASSSYSHLLKLLGRLIRHAAQYVADQMIVFIMNTGNDSEIFAEYDAFFLRAIQAICWAECHSTWQVLATFPWEHLSIHALWGILYHFQTKDLDNDWGAYIETSQDYQQKLADVNIQKHFIEESKDMTENNLYFLLTTLANMANGRPNLEFMSNACYLIIQIGFSDAMLTKSSRNIIAELVDEHPSLVSKILEMVKDNLITYGLAKYIVKGISLNNYIPLPVDINLLSDLLYNGEIDTDGFAFAQYMLDHINWNFNSSGALFLPIELHYSVGLLVTSASLKHCPGMNNETGTMLTEGIKQVTSLVRTPTSKYPFGDWCWNLLLKLKLHKLDQSDDTVIMTLISPQNSLRNVPELESLKDVAEGVQRKHPVACLFSLLATMSGHSIPVIHSKGFDQLNVLQEFEEHDTTIHLLYLITPLFINCQDALLESPKFITVIEKLIKSIGIADRFWYGSVKENITKSFCNMISYQLINYNRYRLANPSPLVNLWLRSLTKLDWMNNVCAVYVINSILEFTFFFPNAWDSTTEIFKDLSKTISSNETTNPGLMRWISSPSNSLLPTCCTAPWLALCILDLEFTEYEIKTGLWQEVLKQLALATGKASVDNALKKATTELNMPLITSSKLCIYRWASIAMQVPIDHPSAPLMWQRFFYLVLDKVVLTSIEGSTTKYPGQKFFEGITNSLFFNKILKHLEQCDLHFKQIYEETRPDNDKKYQAVFADNLSKLYQTYKRWLTDERFFTEDRQNVLDYEFKMKLIAIQSGDTRPWVEFINLQAMREEVSKNAQLYKLTTTKEKYTIRQKRAKKIINPIDDILSRLTSYEKPLQIPEIVLSQYTSQECTPKDLSNLESLMKILKPQFGILLQFLNKYNLRISEHSSLDSEYSDMFLNVVSNDKFVKTATVNCTSYFGNIPMISKKECAGPAIIAVQYKTSQVNDAILKKMSINREEASCLIHSATNNFCSKICKASVIISETVRQVCQANSIGEQLFHVFIGVSPKFSSLNFEPINVLFNENMKLLSDRFINGREQETIRLLQSMDANNANVTGTCDYIDITKLTPSAFITMYKFTITKLKHLEDENMLHILSRVDIKLWLERSGMDVNGIIFTELFNIMESIILSSRTEDIQDEVAYKVYVNHFIELLLWKFPVNYWFCLNIILKGLDTNTAPSYFLEQILLLLTNGVKESCGKPLSLGYDLSVESSKYLSDHFKSVRLQYGLHGIYSKYIKYIDFIQQFLKLISCTVLERADITQDGAYFWQLCSVVLDLWKPWIIPYTLDSLNPLPPTWIISLAPNTGILLPWSAKEDNTAECLMEQFVQVFKDSKINFIGSPIFHITWNFYCMNFLDPNIPNYILLPVHNQLIDMEWENFEPFGHDLEFMRRIVNRYMPTQHTFLAEIFSRMKWKDWIEKQNWSNNDNLTILGFFLEVLVHVAYSTPSKVDAILELLKICDKYNWAVVNVDYELLFNWFIQNCSPMCIMEIADEKINDRLVLKILENAFGVRPCPATNSFPKQLLYTKTRIRLIAGYNRSASYFKSIKTEEYSAAIMKTLNPIATAIEEGNVATFENNVEYGKKLLSEGLLLLNQVKDPTFAQLAKSSILSWIQSIKGYTLVILLQIGDIISDEAVRGEVMECIIQTYFKNTVCNETPTWSTVVDLMKDQKLPLIKIIVPGGHLMLLHVKFLILSVKEQDQETRKTLVKSILETLNFIPSLEPLEYLVPLIWSDFFRNCKLLAVEHQLKCYVWFCHHLQNKAEQNGGILGAMGLRKNTISPKFQLLCKIMRAFILAQISNTKKSESESEIITRNQAITSLRTHKVASELRNIYELGMEQVNSKQNLDLSNSVLKSIISLSYDNAYIYDMMVE